MKILKVSYSGGMANFVIEGFDKYTFCVPLQKKVTKQDVIDELGAKIAGLGEDENKDKFESLKLKDLEGSELNG